MPRQTFISEVRGLDVLQEKLRNKRFIFDPTRQRLIKGAGIAARKTAQRAAKPHPADKGTLGRAILLDFAVDGLTARVDIASRVAGIAFTIEEGRKPGRRPPYGAIRRWAVSHGYAPEGKGVSKIVREMQERIKYGGTKGVHFMRQAKEVADKVLREGVPGTEQEIRALWERK